MSADIPIIARLDIPALDDTMGALLIGVLISGALWGISCAQTYAYFSTYKDRRFLRVTVLLSFFINTAHEILISHAIYTYLVTWYRDFLLLNDIVWSLALQELISTFNIMLVQCFLIWRVWILAGQQILYVIPLILLALLQFASSIAYYAKTQRLSYLTQSSTLNATAFIDAGAGGACNAAIAVALIMLLHRSKSSFSRSNHVLQHLIILFITSGLVISLFHLLVLTVTAALPNTLVFTTFYFPVSKLYTNSLLMTLNVRDKLQNSLSDPVAMDAFPFGTKSNTNSVPQAVTIHVVSDVMVEISPSDDAAQSIDNHGSGYELSVFDPAKKEGYIP